MKVLNLDQITLKMSGIINSKSKSNHMSMLVSKYVCAVTPIAFLLPLLAFFVQNIRDVGQATSAFYLICIDGMASTTYFEFWLKRSTVSSLIRRIQAIVDDSIGAYRPFYTEIESTAYKIVHYYKIIVFILVFGVVSVPLIVFIYLWATGNYSSEKRLLPATYM